MPDQNVDDALAFMRMVSEVFGASELYMEREMTYLTRAERLSKRRLEIINDLMNVIYINRYKIMSDLGMRPIFEMTGRLLALETETLEMIGDESDSMAELGRDIAEATRNFARDNES